MKYRVGWTYQIWIDVEADSPEEAEAKALWDVSHDFQDQKNSGAYLELDEDRDVIVLDEKQIAELYTFY